MVQHKCGRHYIERNKKNKQICNNLVTDKCVNFANVPTSKCELYTSYLGKVVVQARCLGDNIYMETIFVTSKNRTIFIKVLDQLDNNLDDSYVYQISQLMFLPSVCINKTENLYKYIITLLCYLKINEIEHVQDNINKYKKLSDDIITPEIRIRIQSEYPELFTVNPSLSTKFYKKILQKALEYNSRVDILFVCLEYLSFINTITNGEIDTINNQNVLIFVSGVPKLDNAYWNGSYMVFGNGDSIFYPLTSVDVIGHELTHGLLQGICDLEYKGHSGALNESYADIFGSMLEFYIYDKYPELLGKGDWFIGEDLMIDRSCLRNLQDPHACEQPSSMYDQYYVDPNSMIDYGGVHINSGIPNHCFYLTSQSIDKYEALKIFILCLYKLFTHANFFNFSETLAKSSLNDNVYNALNKVGLPQDKEKHTSSDKTSEPKNPSKIPDRIPSKIPDRIPSKIPGRNSPGRNSPGRNSPGRNSPGRNSPGRNSPGRRIPKRLPNQFPSQSLPNQSPSPSIPIPRSQPIPYPQYPQYPQQQYPQYPQQQYPQYPQQQYPQYPQQQYPQYLQQQYPQYPQQQSAPIIIRYSTTII